jgi:molecular chaperone GrpE
MEEHRGPEREAAEEPLPAGDRQGGENAAAEVQQDIDEMLEETKRERDEYLELAKRTKADFENYRRRMAAEADAAALRGKSELAGSLVGVIDNLERALAAAEIDAAAARGGEASAEGPLEQGIVLTYRELSEVLARAGVEPYDPAGERFDPAWHEALQTRAAEGTEPGTVVEVLQKGYRLDGQVIRAARVVVSE